MSFNWLRFLYSIGVGFMLPFSAKCGVPLGGGALLFSAVFALCVYSS